MTPVHKHAARQMNYALAGPDALPLGEDELSLRDARHARPRTWRPLKSGEIDQLVRQGNWAADWGDVLVHPDFLPRQVHRCRFMGVVRLGLLEPLVLEHDGLVLPVGLYDSTIVASDIGDNVVIDHVGYLAHMIVEDDVVLHRVGLMQTRSGARFGHGALRPGEDPARRDWLDVGNESGGRRIAAFAGMVPADAFLWARNRSNAALLQRLEQLTDARLAPHPCVYGVVGRGAVVRECRTLIDVDIGPAACLEGAERIQNVTIRSDEHEPAWVGEGTELLDGVVGYGCRVGQGAKAVRFVLGTRARLLMGTRVLHSVVGDNATIACAEVQHSLIGPSHEQHHNNSFLIAATLGGQSNIAAGATLGSNHSSRAPDGELLAGRGFWPGLCTSFKYPSRFASFVLVATGTYPYELNIPLPFSLVSVGEGGRCLQVAPAWYFVSNMYAVQRNAGKFRARDARFHAEQHIEFDPLAPDTVEEILKAMELLEGWAAEAVLRAHNDLTRPAPGALRLTGRSVLLGDPDVAAKLDIVGEGLEHSLRPTRILKAAAGYRMYRDMVRYYAVRTLVDYMKAQGLADPRELPEALGDGDPVREWTNLGGQIVPAAALADLIERIAGGRVDSWDQIHGEYNLLWRDYPREKARHALAVLGQIEEWPLDRPPDAAAWARALEHAASMQQMIVELTHASRERDFTSPFRTVTYRSPEEMAAVVGSADRDPVVTRVRQEGALLSEVFKALAKRMREFAGS